MTGTVTIAPGSVVDGEGRERAGDGLTAEQAMEKGFRENEIWQTPAGKIKMEELRAIAAQRRQVAQPDAAAAMEARDEIERLKADPLWRQQWAAGSPQHAKQLETLIHKSLGRAPPDSARAGQKRPATWGLLTPAEKSDWEQGR
jgi:hypothetical protein